MQNSHDEVRSLLIQMQGEGVVQAEETLAKYSAKPHFLDIIMIIIRGENEQEWVKTIACAFLNNLFMERAQQEPQSVSTVLREIVMDAKIKPLDKHSFEKSIAKMIAHGTEDLRDQWQKLISELMQDKQHFDSAYLILASFAVADDIPDEIVRKMVRNNFQVVVQSLEVCLQNSNLLNQMIKTWIVVFDRLREGEQNTQVAYFMANSKRVLDLIDLIYDFYSGENVVVCLNPELYELNLLKYQATELNKRFLMFTIESGTACPTVLSYAKKNFIKFVKTIYSLSVQRSLIETLTCEDLVTTLFSLLQLYLEEVPQEFSFTDAANLIEANILPFVQAGDQEREKFQESPEQFNSLTEDCCDKQTYGILKTEAIKLLECIGDKVQGCLHYIANRAIESIKVKMGFIYVSQHDRVLQIETSFLILSVFSYGVCKLLPQQKKALQVIMCDERTKSLPPLQLSRVFTFLAYNYNEVFPNPSDGEGWFELALIYKAHPTTRYCAFDFMSNLVEDYFSEKFLEGITNQITDGKIALIWEIINKIIENHYNEISAKGIVSVVNKLFERIKKEVTQLESQEKNVTLDLINCLHQFTGLLVTMRQNPLKNAETVARDEEIIKHIWPIIELYRIALKWDIQDEVVRVTIEIVNVLPRITPQIYPLITQYGTLYKQNCYTEKVYLRFFNQFIIKADFMRDQSVLLETIVILKNALLSSVMTVSNPAEKFKGTQQEKVNLGNILIVTQHILAIHGNNLLLAQSYEYFNEIGSLCLRLLPIKEQEIEKTSSARILMSRALTTLFLCHMHCRMDCFFDYMVGLRGQNLYHGYDTQVLVGCISKQVFRETDLTILTMLITSMLQIVQKSQEKDGKIEKKRKTSSKRSIINNHKIKKIDQFDKLLRSINSPFKQGKTLGQQIIELFCTMNSGNAELVQQIISTLPAQTLAILKTYVDINNLSKTKRVIRKVIGIKDSVTIEEESMSKKRCTMHNDESDEEQEINLKRMRVRAKIDKKNDKTKNLKKIKIQEEI